MERSSDPGAKPASGPAATRSDVHGVLGADDVLGHALARWASVAAVDEAARARARERWLRIQAEEEASLVGTLVDLAERGRPVALDVGDHRLRGVVVGIGEDFVALRADPGPGRGHDVLVHLRAIDVVRAEPGGVDVRGDRSTRLEVTLGSVIGPVAADRPDVHVRTFGGATVRGQLRSAGTDVLRLLADGEPPTPAWVPLDAVAVLVIGV